MFVWKVLIILLAIVSCKPLVRQTVSDINAISDAQLMLGTVPIERDDGTQAYRLLLCKKSDSYPIKMLTDDSRCRVALLDQDGAEVALLPNKFKRSFGDKYKGYAKGAAVSLAIVPIALAAGYAGAWRYARRVRKTTEKLIKNVQLKVKIADDLADDAGKIDNAWNFHRANWERRLHGLLEKLEEIDPQVDSYVYKRVREALDEVDYRIPLALLKEIENMKGVFRGYEQLSEDEIIDIMHEYGDKLSKLQIADASAPRLMREIANSEPVDVDFGGLKATVKRDADAIAYHQRGIVQVKLGSFFHPGKHTDSSIHETTRMLMDDLDTLKQETLDYLRKAEEDWVKKQEKLVREDADTKLQEGNNRLQEKTATVTGGAGLAAMIALDKSVWGYGDRQVSKHWSQVFVESDDFQDISVVRDVRLFLSALAEELGYVVNKRALQLAD